MTLEELKDKLTAIDGELEEIRAKLDDPETSTDELETRSNELIDERTTVMAEIEKVSVNAPVHIGDIVIKDVLGTGSDIVATKEIA